MQKRLLFWVIMILLSSFVVEGVSYIAFGLGASALKARTYYSPKVSRSEFESYLADRHPILGWPGKTRWGKDLTATGARRSPANERLANGSSCVSLYGDSFTFSSEVTTAEAWGNLLAEQLLCRVENYAVPGYGTDQAVLRFISNTRDSSPVTILGIHPVDLTRNLNQWHLLIAGPHATFGFKPVFTERGDGLELVELPALNFEDYQRLTEDPSQYLKEEYFLPGGRGPVVVEFPYTASLFRLVWKVFGEFSLDRMMKYPKPRQWNRDRWYENDGSPNSHAASRNALIVKRFAAECNKREIRCVVLIIPDKDSLDSHIIDGIEPLDWVYSPFEDVVEVWDATTYIASKVDNELGVCKYIGERKDCKGHYNAQGYKLLADYVQQKLTASK